MRTSRRSSLAGLRRSIAKNPESSELPPNLASQAVGSTTRRRRRLDPWKTVRQTCTALMVVVSALSTERGNR